VDQLGALVGVAQRNKRSSLGRQGRASLRRTWLSATNGSTDGSILVSLLELLTTARTFRSGCRLMSTSTVGCQVRIVDRRDWVKLVLFEKSEMNYLQRETGVVDRMYWYEN
jgi:hypothetical protein